MGMTRRFCSLAAAGALAGLVAIAPGCASLEGARLYRSGTAALDGGEPDRAIEDLERAARLIPHASEIRNHLGLAYAASGRREQAIREFRSAVDLDCDNLAAAHNLAIAQSASERREPAGESATRKASAP